jgi:hypothetical protein
MRQSWIIGLCTMVLAGVSGAAEKTEDSWKTYRNERFGYELSYPADMEYRAYVDGASGELRTAGTGHRLVDFEVWPPGECPRQPTDAIASEVGIERAKTMTQADGPDGSSSCGDPVTARESVSPNGVKIYELALTCVRASDGSHDDTDETDPPPSAEEPVITAEGTKGPTYFADISPAWKKRVLMADPVGVDPRMQETKGKIDLAILRTILGTLTTFPIQKPPGVCIEEFQPRGISIGVPPR